jgi:hypothetical protein
VQAIFFPGRSRHEAASTEAKAPEPWLPERGLGGEPALRVGVEQAAQNLEAGLRELLLREHLPQAPGVRGVALLPQLGGQIASRQPLQPRPLDDALCPHRALHLLEDLGVQVGAEERLAAAGDELGHDASEPPRVDPAVVVLGAEEDLRRAVRARRRQRRGAVPVRPRGPLGHAEAADPVDHLLPVPPLVDDHVLRHHVPVQDAGVVHAPGAGEELAHGVAHLGLQERPPLDGAEPHVLAQVQRAGVPGDEEAVAVAAGAVGVRGHELDDRGVAAAGAEGHSLPGEVAQARLHEPVVGPAAEALHGDEAPADAVPGFVDVAKHALAQLLEGLVPLRHGRRPGDAGAAGRRPQLFLHRRLWRFLLLLG